MTSVADKRRVLVNAAANGLGFVAQLAILFVLSPLLVHGLGDRRYGMWSLVESILAYLTLLDLGVAASVVRYVARFEATGDRDGLNRVVGTSACLFAVAGTIALTLAGLVALVGLPLLGVPEDLAGEATGLL